MVGEAGHGGEYKRLTVDGKCSTPGLPLLNFRHPSNCRSPLRIGGKIMGIGFEETASDKEINGNR